MSVFNAYYYNEQFKKYIIQFMAIFAGMQVRVGSTGEKEPRIIPVPIVYGSKDRVVADIKAQNVQTKLIRLPTFSTYLTNIELAPDLQKGIGATKRQTVLPTGGLFPDDIQVVHQRMPVPYRTYFELMVFASNTDQHMQIIEQILMLFDPILQIQTSDEMFDWTKISTVKMEGIRLEENYPVGPGRRVIQTAIDFSVPTYISVPNDVRKDYIEDIYCRLGIVDEVSPTSQEVVDDLDSQGLEYNLIFSLGDITIDQPIPPPTPVRPPTDECRPTPPPVGSPPKEPGYDIDCVTYDNVFFTTTTQDASPNDVFLKPDGTKMFVLGAQNDRVYEYNLLTPWEVTSASFVQSFFTGTQDASPVSLYFRSDGLLMAVGGGSNDRIFRYDLSVAWDISTASFVHSGIADNSPVGVYAKPDGLIYYNLGSISKSVRQIPMSPAWDFSSGTGNTGQKNVSAQDSTPRGTEFTPDGERFFVIGAQNNMIYEYLMTIPWDVNTASYTRSAGIVPGSNAGFAFGKGGTKLYTVELGDDKIHQYTVGCGSP